MWAREFRRPGAAGQDRWVAFGGTGRAARRVTLPEGALPLWVAGDEVLLLETDALGVERVRGYRVVPVE